MTTSTSNPTPHSPLPTPLEWLWEIPLSFLSFIFSRILKVVMQSLTGVFSAANPQASPEWQLVSAKFLEKPVKLLWAMSRARWNLHAMVSIVGPLEVKEVISIDITSAQKSAKSWTVVLYTTPSFETIDSFSSLTVSGENQWESFKLQPGRYLLGLRYYHWTPTVEVPTVKVDGVKVVEAKTIPAPRDVNGFYRDLIKRKTFLHVWLNYYVFSLLRFKQWLPEKFVKDVFLPVPNPETRFYYGAVKPGEVVKFELNPELVANYYIYYSLYSHECFPLDWYPISESAHKTAANQQKSLYIVRIHPKFSQEAEFKNEWVNINTCSDIGGI